MRRIAACQCRLKLSAAPSTSIVRAALQRHPPCICAAHLCPSRRQAGACPWPCTWRPRGGCRRADARGRRVSAATGGSPSDLPPAPLRTLPCPLSRRVSPPFTRAPGGASRCAGHRQARLGAQRERKKGRAALSGSEDSLGEDDKAEAPAMYVVSGGRERALGGKAWSERGGALAPRGRSAAPSARSLPRAARVGIQHHLRRFDGAVLRKVGLSRGRARERGRDGSGDGKSRGGCKAAKARMTRAKAERIAYARRRMPDGREDNVFPLSHAHAPAASPQWS